MQSNTEPSVHSTPRPDTGGFFICPFHGCEIVVGSADLKMRRAGVGRDGRGGVGSEPKYCSRHNTPEKRLGGWTPEYTP